MPPPGSGELAGSLLLLTKSSVLSDQAPTLMTSITLHYVP